MGVVVLDIFRDIEGTEKVIAKANKWRFQDVVMGEQFITCTITSEIPIEWEIGDHCTFRGQTYTLNYIPSVTQKAPSNSVQDAYTYENVKFDSFQDELTRCMMLDVTPTTDEYVAMLGTNHTGSSRFQLYCGEMTVNGSTLTAVCALALKMQANLDRLYPGAWNVYVDTTTSYETPSGETLLVTHTDSKLLTFDNSTVAQAVALVHTEFKLDYCIKGRNIYIGYSIDSVDPRNPVHDITSDNIVFGYGKGYPSASDQGKGLFQIKQIANSQQKIVTRLRALGSTKNLPYNYYFKKYGLLSQSLFPNNLQLPGTFLPLGEQTDAADADGLTKWSQNNARSQYLRKVLGDTNDSYIDKNDDAAGCVEGIREDCARWDGSNGDLPEIYPTIEGVTFGELRNAGVPDQTGATGPDAYQKGQTKPNGEPVQPDWERVDCLLAVGQLEDGTLVDDANIGDGVMPESEVIDAGDHFPIGIGTTRFIYDPLGSIVDDSSSSESRYAEGQEHELFTVKNVSPGYYFMVPTGPSYSSVAFRFSISSSASTTADVGFIIRVKQKTDRNTETIATWASAFTTIGTAAGEKEMFLPEIPDIATSGQVESIHVTALSDIIVTFSPVIGGVSENKAVTMNYKVGMSQSGEYDPEYNWCSVQGGAVSKYPFHVFIKDMGFDLTASFNGETPVMAMKSGHCVGREFEIGENVQRATVNGIRGYVLTLNRVEDSSLHTYYPNENYRLSAGDYFVLLNINMPDAYIRAAELRLLKAATEYLADNCETKYTYQPSIDDIYLKRDLDAMTLEGTPEKSVFWRLYAGLRFRFNGIPSSPSSQLPMVSMTIEQVAITMGDGLTPKVEITLNDDVQQTTLQKLTVAVDRIYNGSIFSSGGTGTNMEAVVDIGNRLFLSRVHDDIANGRITFNDIATFIGLIKAKGGVSVGEFLSGFFGSGARIGADGRAEFEEVNVRGAIRAAELVFNRINAEEGEAIRSIGHGEILIARASTATTGTITLKLEGDEWPTVEAGDICRGMYNTVNQDYDNSDIVEGFDVNGFRTKRGFFSSYFKVLRIVRKSKGNCSFTYELQNDGNGNPLTEHPCDLMKFAVYGNTNNAKKERQSSMYITAVGIAPRLLFLAGVNDWAIKPENVKIALGNIQDISVWEEVTQAEYASYSGTDGVNKKTWDETVDGETFTHYAVIKDLQGDAGFYCEDNIYLGGIIDQFKSAALDAITAELGNIGQAWVMASTDTIVVDCTSDGEVAETKSVTLDSWLYFGNNRTPCLLDTGTTAGISNCHYDYGGRNYRPSFLDENTKATRTFTFTQGDSLVSGEITILLKGELDDVEYTATKTVAVIANKQGKTGQDGNDGDDGRGISNVTTWYKLSTLPEGVQAAKTANPINEGWVSNYVEPTELLPYLWRFTRYTFTSGTQYEDSECELVFVYQSDANPNLLADTDFLTYSTGGWDVIGETSDSSYAYGIDVDHYNGHNAYYANGQGGDDLARMLSQVVYSDDKKRIEGGKWYTLSFYTDGQGYITVWPPAIDTASGVKMYVNGVEMQSQEYVRIEDIDHEIRRIVITFKTLDTLSSDYSCVWDVRDMDGEQRGNTVYVTMPKLEIGKFATRYVAMQVNQEPFTRLTEWESGKTYYGGLPGEPYLDVCAYNGKWYKCLRTHVSSTRFAPSSALSTNYWRQANNFDFIASGLFLAERAVIKNLVAEDLQTGEIGHPHVRMFGSTIQFYGNQDTPSIELTTDNDGVGVLRFYDKNGVPMYDLGPNQITAIQSVENTYTETLLKSIVDGTSKNTLMQVLNVTNGDCTVYFKFSEGYVSQGMNKVYKVSNSETPSSYNGKVYTTENYQGSTIQDGWYVAVNNGHWAQIALELFSVKAFHYVNGRVAHFVDICFKNENDWWRDSSGTIRGGLASGTSLVNFLDSQAGITIND